jgi:hypothetical protein
VHFLRVANYRLVLSPIDVATMANRDNDDEQHSVIESVNDSRVANPQSVTLTPSEGP